MIIQLLWNSGFEIVQFGKNGGERNSNVFRGGRGPVKKVVKVYELLVVVIAHILMLFSFDGWTGYNLLSITSRFRRLLNRPSKLVFEYNTLMQ